MTEEVWKEIPRPFSKYEASSLGRVRNAKTKRILNPQMCTDGCPGYSMFRDDRHTQNLVRAGVWVWRTFYGDPGSHYYIRHIDGDKGNAALENLELISCSAYRTEWYADYNARMDALFEETRSELDDYIFGSCVESEAERRSRVG